MINIAAVIKLVLQASIVLLVFGLGLRASWMDAMYLFFKPGLLLRSLLAMNIIMPLLVIALTAAFKFTPAVEIALLVLSISPVPPLLPLKQLKHGGEQGYVYGLLVVAALFGIVFVPIAVSLFGGILGVVAAMPAGAVAGIVLLTVLVPLGAGMLVRWRAPELAERFSEPISRTGTILLLLGACGLLVMALPDLFTLIGNGTLAAILAFVVVSLSVGHLLGGPVPGDRRTLALATASRHPAVALSIATANYREARLAAAAIVLYLIVNLIGTISYVRWCKGRLGRMPAAS